MSRVCRNITSKSSVSPIFNDKEVRTNAATNKLTKDIVLTPGQKVLAGANLTLWTGAVILATASAYYIIKELFPSKMSPNVVFDKAFSVVKKNNIVTSTFGSPLKAYGKDHGGHREGRRNFVEHTHYIEESEGSKRTRIRFNIQGQYGSAFVFAEVSNKMSHGDFVYVLVQDKRNGNVITVVDNRSAIVARIMAGDCKEGQEAFRTLLGERK